MAGLLSKIAGSVVSSAAKAAASAAAKASGSRKSGTSGGSAGSASAGGVASVYDRQLLSGEDLAAIQRYSAAAKSASAAGDQAAVKSAHAGAEAIRAKYGYSGGQLGDAYIPLETQTPAVETYRIPKADTSGMRETLQQQTQAAAEQQAAGVDYATSRSIRQLQQAQETAEEQLQTMRDQISLEERQALDNQALYAEARGDRGGIGQAQYGAVENTAARNRLAVNRQQVKLAADTQRQMAELRAQGEFEKADALLSLSQSYLSQLMALERWAAEYNLSAAEFNADLAQWEQTFHLKTGELLGTYQGRPTLEAQKQQDSVNQTLQKTLAEAGTALLKAGILPSPAQLSAMGVTAAEARAYLSRQQAERTVAKSGANNPSSAGKQDYEALFAAAKNSPDARSYIANNYRRYGFSVSTGLWDAYQTWQSKRKDSGRASVDFDEDEGIFTWNGGRYADLRKLLTAMKEAELTAAEKAALEEKFARWGYEIALP